MAKEMLRLKDLENISSKEPDYTIIMKEVLGYKNKRFLKTKHFKKCFIKAHVLISGARKVNPSFVKHSLACKIKRPKNIDGISFRAMMELQSLLNNYDSEQDFSEFMANIITTACFSEKYSDDYSSNSHNFKMFFKEILNNPLWEMTGLYNSITEDLLASQKDWEERFFSVEVEDKDYSQAGGARMAQFNVINTIKSICSDFNVDYDRAWQVSYALTQTNSYAKATANYTQDQMRQIKELRMKQSRAQK